MASSHSRRSRGEGSVYQASEGRWRAALLVTDPRSGAPLRRVVSGRSRAEVVRKLGELKRDAASGAVPTSITTAAFLARWLEGERARVRAASWRQREGHVRTWITPAIGTVPLARLTPADVERMTGALVTRGLSANSAAKARVTLRRALGDALRDGLVARNVAALARPPHVPAKDLRAGRDYLTTSDLRRLLEAAVDHQLGPLVTLAATTGLRQGELLGLAWEDVRIDGPAPSLTVRRSLARAYNGTGWELAEPKTGRSRRTLNLPAVAVGALRAQRVQQDAARAAVGTAWQDRDGLVFTDAVGQPLRGSTVTRQFHALLEAAGLPSVTFHALRHSAATALLTAGVPLRVVGDLLGHSTIAITSDIYGGVAPETRREAADAMDRAVGGAS